MVIEISKMIAHKLNLTGSNCILSDSCINLDNLDNAENALAFFKEHIENMRDYGYTRSCCFESGRVNTIRDFMGEITEALENPDVLEGVFVEKSKKMARKLRNIMMSTSSTSDGSLFVLLYSTDGNNYIGILKMDPNTGIEITDQLNIIVRPEMLPSPKERLHKSALIKMLGEYETNEVHLFTLDRQRGNSEPAKYFMTDFLQARELANDRNLTLQYQSAIFTEFEDVIPPERFPIFSNEFKRTLSTGNAINIDEDIPRIIRETVPELRDADFTENVRRVLASVRVKYPDATSNFDPDPKKVRPTIYKSYDKSIEITISPDVDEDWYTEEYDEETGETVFRFSEEAGLHRENR